MRWVLRFFYSESYLCQWMLIRKCHWSCELTGTCANILFLHTPCGRGDWNPIQSEFCANQVAHGWWSYLSYLVHFVGLSWQFEVRLWGYVHRNLFIAINFHLGRHGSLESWASMLKILNYGSVLLCGTCKASFEHVLFECALFDYQWQVLGLSETSSSFFWMRLN